MWKEVDGIYWFRARWYIIPEETAAGRQPHNLRRELYRTNDFADVEVMSAFLGQSTFRFNLFYVQFLLLFCTDYAPVQQNKFNSSVSWSSVLCLVSILAT